MPPLSRFAPSPLKGDAASAAGRPLRGDRGPGQRLAQHLWVLHTHVEHC